jgi:hypothetical protein
MYRAQFLEYLSVGIYFDSFMLSFESSCRTQSYVITYKIYNCIIRS